MIKRKKVLSIMSVVFLTLLLGLSMIFGALSISMQNAGITKFSASQNISESYEEQREEVAAPEGYEVKVSYLDVLNSYYEQFCDYCETSGVDVEVMSFAEFSDGFYEQEVMSITEYIDYLIDYVDNFTQFGNGDYSNFELPKNEITTYSSSSDGSWFHNTGTSLPRRVSYGKYNFSGVQAGDVMYEVMGFVGITGHIAIIEGKFYDSTYNMDYFRTIESIKQFGVCRGVLDDDRFLIKKGTIYSVKGATLAKRNEAISFCESQLGKPWKIQTSKPTESTTPKWQCSTLVWAAYMNQGIDLEEKGVGGGIGITPHDIRDGSNSILLVNF